MFCTRHSKSFLRDIPNFHRCSIVSLSVAKYDHSTGVVHSHHSHEEGKKSLHIRHVLLNHTVYKLRCLASHAITQSVLDDGV